MSGPELRRYTVHFHATVEASWEAAQDGDPGVQLELPKNDRHRVVHDGKRYLLLRQSRASVDMHAASDLWYVQVERYGALVWDTKLGRYEAEERSTLREKTS